MRYSCGRSFKLLFKSWRPFFEFETLPLLQVEQLSLNFTKKKRKMFNFIIRLFYLAMLGTGNLVRDL